MGHRRPQMLGCCERHIHCHHWTECEYCDDTEAGGTGMEGPMDYIVECQFVTTGDCTDEEGEENCGNANSQYLAEYTAPCHWEWTGNRVVCGSTTITRVTVDVIDRPDLGVGGFTEVRAIFYDGAAELMKARKFYATRPPCGSMHMVVLDVHYDTGWTECNWYGKAKISLFAKPYEDEVLPPTGPVGTSSGTSCEHCAPNTTPLNVDVFLYCFWGYTGICNCAELEGWYTLTQVGTCQWQYQGPPICANPPGTPVTIDLYFIAGGVSGTQGCMIISLSSPYGDLAWEICFTDEGVEIEAGDLDCLCPFGTRHLCRYIDLIPNLIGVPVPGTTCDGDYYAIVRVCRSTTYE